MTEHLPECPCVHHPSEDLWCICWRLRECSTRTTADALQRVEAILAPLPNTWPSMIRRSDAIAAIKGDQP
jgi:hypothetical protein